jgi:Transposase DDE domain
VLQDEPHDTSSLWPRRLARSAFSRPSCPVEECLKAAQEQVETLKKLADEDTAGLTRQQRAARERAARERLQRIEEAMRQCEELQEQRDASYGRKGREAPASTTDPEARVMKFPDGGYGPGYNVQFASETETGMIGGVEVTNAGNDGEELPPMLDQLEERYERMPNEALVDGGFATKDAIDQADQRGCTVYEPIRAEEKKRADGEDRYAPKKGDSDAVAAWRSRMGTRDKIVRTPTSHSDPPPNPGQRHDCQPDCASGVQTIRN